MNKELLKAMRQELMATIQKYAGWMSEKQLIDLARGVGLTIDEVFDWKVGVK